MAEGAGTALGMRACGANVMRMLHRCAQCASLCLSIPPPRVPTTACLPQTKKSVEDVSPELVVESRGQAHGGGKAGGDASKQARRHTIAHLHRDDPMSSEDEGQHGEEEQKPRSLAALKAGGKGQGGKRKSAPAHIALAPAQAATHGGWPWAVVAGCTTEDEALCVRWCAAA